MESKVKKTVCVDLDGVLAHYKEWKGVHHIGEPISGSQKFVKLLREKFKVTIFTTRCSTEVNKGEADELAMIVHRWLEKNGFEYDSVYCGQGKPIASAYIDDRAVMCQPQKLPIPEQAYQFALDCVAKLEPEEVK
jgi:hypothetical protein